MHNVHAIIGAEAELLNDPSLISPGCAIRLKHGMALIPVNNAFYRAKCGEAPPSVIETFEFLTPAFLDWLRLASKGRRLVYVETDYFGGAGGQGAVVMADSECLHGPAFGDDGHIDQALTFLGLVASDGKDLFETVGLNEHQSTAQWIRAAGAASGQHD